MQRYLNLINYVHSEHFPLYKVTVSTVYQTDGTVFHGVVFRKTRLITQTSPLVIACFCPVCEAVVPSSYLVSKETAPRKAERADRYIRERLVEVRTRLDRWRKKFTSR